MHHKLQIVNLISKPGKDLIKYAHLCNIYFECTFSSDYIS
jgi:hypothetical protein